MSDERNETADQLKAHIEIARRNHYRLTGFSPNTIVICHDHLATLLQDSSLSRYAWFDGGEHFIRGMMVVEDRYSKMPRVMFEHRPVR